MIFVYFHITTVSSFLHISCHNSVAKIQKRNERHKKVPEKFVGFRLLCYFCRKIKHKT